MNWALITILGAILNVAVSWGYKIAGGKSDVFLFSAIVYAISGITFLIIAAIKGHSLNEISQIHLLLPTLMGIGSAIGLLFFIMALEKGPISLVNPLWSCAYALGSVLIGLCLARENPSAPALTGIGLYIIGALLMARG